MNRIFTNKKSLLLLLTGILAPFSPGVLMAQPPPDPPPPPEVASIAGAAIAIIILGCVGYGVYSIYKKNSKKVKTA
jgi:hypothetical protein